MFGIVRPIFRDPHLKGELNPLGNCFLLVQLKMWDRAIKKAMEDVIMACILLMRINPVPSKDFIIKQTFMT